MKYYHEVLNNSCPTWNFARSESWLTLKASLFDNILVILIIYIWEAAQVNYCNISDNLIKRKKTQQHLITSILCDYCFNPRNLEGGVVGVY